MAKESEITTSVASALRRTWRKSNHPSQVTLIDLLVEFDGDTHDAYHAINLDERDILLENARTIASRKS